MEFKSGSILCPHYSTNTPSPLSKTKATHFKKGLTFRIQKNMHGSLFSSHLSPLQYFFFFFFIPTFSPFINPTFSSLQSFNTFIFLFFNLIHHPHLLCSQKIKKKKERKEETKRLHIWTNFTTSN